MVIKFIFMFIIGTILGSFYLVIGTRMPKGENVLTSRSKCDYCNTKLKWYNLIPLFSYIFQRGKCTNCHKKISADHFWVELITGLLFGICCFYFEIGYYFYMGLIVISLMIIIFVSDFKYMIILDSPLICGGLLAIILKYIYFGFKPCLISITSGLIMFLAMFLVEKIGSFILKKEALGGGDIKLSFTMGLILDLKLGITALVLSSFLALPYAVASVVLKKDHQLPYGPFLIGAVFIVFFHYEKFNMLLEFLFPFL